MQYDGYDFTQLEIAEMKAGIEQRIKQYEANIFDAMMDQKAEAATRNPQKGLAIAQHQRKIDDLKRAIDAMRYEIEMLDMAAEAEKQIEPEESLGEAEQPTLP
jgi:hypothetical protein